MNSKRIALGLVAILAVSCGGQASDQLEESREVRVQKVIERYHDKYGEALDEASAALGGDGTDQPIEQDIADACASGPDGRGTEQDKQGMGFAMVLLTPTLQKHGLDWVGFVNDTAKVNVDIQQIAGC